MLTHVVDLTIISVVDWSVDPIDVRSVKDSSAMCQYLYRGGVTRQTDVESDLHIMFQGRLQKMLFTIRSFFALCQRKVRPDLHNLKMKKTLKLNKCDYRQTSLGHMIQCSEMVNFNRTEADLTSKWGEFSSSSMVLSEPV